MRNETKMIAQTISPNRQVRAITTHEPSQAVHEVYIREVANEDILAIIQVREYLVVVEGGKVVGTKVEFSVFRPGESGMDQAEACKIALQAKRDFDKEVDHHFGETPCSSHLAKP